MNLGNIKNVVRGLRNPLHSILQVRCSQDNLGDIMVADAIEEAFDRVSVVNGERTRMFRTLGGTIGISRVFGSVFLGGGTLIFVPPGVGWLESLQYFTQRTMPLCTFGTGVIDPVFRRHMSELNVDSFAVTDETIDKWIDCLRGFRFLSVRGVESQRILRDHGLQNVEVIGDPALYYSRTTIRPKDRLRKLGINLSSCLEFWNNSQELVVSELSKVIQYLTEDGWCITLFPTETSDHILARETIEATDTNVTICEEHGRPAAFVDQIERQDVFIGTKLHSVVCAFCAYTPAIMVGYQPKCLDFMKTLGFAQYHIRSDQLNAEAVIGLVERIYSDLEQIQHNQFNACQLYRNKMLDFRDRVLDSIGIS